LVEQKALAALAVCAGGRADQYAVVVVAAVIVGVAVAKAVIAYQRGIGLGVQLELC
jgi:hypothetical protein